jgi:hypothetical protein
VEQQDVAQPQALPADVESILQPISADHYTQAQPTAEPVAVVQPAPAPEATPTHEVPLATLLETRHRAQMAEYKAQQAEQQLAEIRGHIEAQQRAAYQQQLAQQPPLDPIGDPEGAFRAVLQRNAQLERQLQDVTYNMPAHITEHIIREKYGDETVDAAVKEAHKAGLGQHFMKQPNPYKALMNWRTQQEIAQQVGPDLKSWEAKKEAEIRARILAETQQQPAARPGQPQILPPSLSSATRANAASPVIQDASDFFKSTLFAKPQRT